VTVNCVSVPPTIHQVPFFPPPPQNLIIATLLLFPPQLPQLSSSSIIISSTKSIAYLGNYSIRQRSFRNLSSTHFDFPIAFYCRLDLPRRKTLRAGAFLWRAPTEPFPSFNTTTIRSIYTILHSVSLDTPDIQPRNHVAPFCASLRHATLLNPVALHTQSPFLDASSVRQRLLSIKQRATRNLSRPSISS
jgi:hypothetical protein